MKIKIFFLSFFLYFNPSYGGILAEGFLGLCAVAASAISIIELKVSKNTLNQNDTEKNDNAIDKKYEEITEDEISLAKNQDDSICFDEIVLKDTVDENTNSLSNDAKSLILKEVNQETPNLARIKKVLLNTPIEDKKAGQFERGVFLFAGLTQKQAMNIQNAIDLESVYDRVSSHPNMKKGFDLQKDAITQTRNETFSHILYQEPLPYREGDDLNSGVSSVIQNAKNFGQEHEDKKYFFRFKPESAGLHSFTDKMTHSIDYVKTRLFSNYKSEPGYYGDANKSLNGNGCFTIEFSPADMTINPWFKRNKA